MTILHFLNSLFPGKKGVDLSPTGEEWGVDQGMLNKLKEEYKKSRRNKGIDRRKYFPFVLF